MNENFFLSKHSKKKEDEKSSIRGIRHLRESKAIKWVVYNFVKGRLDVT